MRSLLRPAVALGFVLAVTASAAPKKDEALGTFTVKGKITKITQVYAATQEDAEQDEYLVLLFTDRPVELGDRSPERLKELAAQGKVSGLRLVWRTAYDDLRWTPYHQALADNGLASQGVGELDLAAFNPERTEGKVSSKMLGQDWHFNVSYKAAIVHGGIVELERLAESEASPEVEEGAAEGQAEANPVELKRRLGKLGFEFKPEAFSYAVKDGNLEAVRLFLTLGQSPDAKDESGLAALMYACMYCQHGSPPQQEQMALALIAAGAKVNIKDQNDSTPLIWAAQSCNAEVVGALLKAGANPNAKAKGGATPLMMAEVMQRQEIVALLKKAGAKP